MRRQRWIASAAVVGQVALLPLHAVHGALVDPVADRMRDDVTALVAGGPRESGTPGEAAAFDVVAGRLADLGLGVAGGDVPLPNGRTSRNRWTSFGTGPVEILLGAHVDTVPISPGADDNASGVAVLLEVARRFDDGTTRVPPGTTVTLVWFGAEERLAGWAANDHHYGSRRLAADRAAAGRLPHWMLSVDMIGYGATPIAVWFDGSDPTGAWLLSKAAGDVGIPTAPTPRGDISDHEAFGRRGVPAALLWRPDNPDYHSAGDTEVYDDRLLAGLRTVEAFVAAAGSPFASNRGLVHEMQVDLLARPPDLGGARWFAGRLDRGQSSPGQVGADLLSSPEWTGSVAPIGRLYRAALGRDADHSGLSFWSGRLRGGQGLEPIAAFFASSPEFGARYGTPDHGAFVDLLYANVLGRTADPGGRSYWVDQLQGGRSRASVVVGFSESVEHRSRTAAALPVALAYVGLLRRSVDPGGLAFWSGRPYADLVTGILASPEFRARFP